MSYSSGSVNFSCPKCFCKITATIEQIGSQVVCTSCGVSLTVPQDQGGGMFDDLFDDAPASEAPSTEKPPKPATAEPAEPIDTDFLQEVPEEFPEVELDVNTTSQPDPTKAVEIIDNVTEPLTPTPETIPSLPALESTDGDSTDETGKDPFAYDETKAISIDEIAKPIASPDAFYFRCPVCESDLQAIEHQIGQQIRCSDCHSDVTVVRPKTKKNKPTYQQPATVVKADDDELTLAPPVERVEVDPTFGLDHIADDLLAPIEVVAVEPESPPVQPSTPTIEDDRAIKRNAQPNKKPRSRSTTKPPASGRTSDAEPSAPVPPESNGKPITLSRISEFRLLGDLDLVVRSIVCIAFLSLGYAMQGYVSDVFRQEDLNGAEKFFKYAPALVGSFICQLGAFWLLAVSFSVVMRSVANGFKKVESWVGFSPSEWMGSFIVVFICAWASSVPGGLLGYLGFRLTEQFVVFPGMIAASVFSLMPIFLISTIHNESAFNIFSPEVLESLQTKTLAWLSAYKWFAMTFAVFVFGLLLQFTPWFIVGAIGASLQVCSLFVLSVIVGLLSQAVIGVR